MYFVKTVTKSFMYLIGNDILRILYFNFPVFSNHLDIRKTSKIRVWDQVLFNLNHWLPVPQDDSFQS